MLPDQNPFRYQERPAPPLPPSLPLGSNSLLADPDLQTAAAIWIVWSQNAALKGYFARPARNEALTDAEQALRWLAQHRGEYVGRWIALQGDELVAVAATAREVFAAIRGRAQTPFVTKVEPIDTEPFVGW